MGMVAIGPSGTVPQDRAGNPVATAPKPRGSLADAVRAKRECVPCNAKREPWEDLTWLKRWAAAGTDPQADFDRYLNFVPQPPVPGPPSEGALGE